MALFEVPLLQECTFHPGGILPFVAVIPAGNGVAWDDVLPEVVNSTLGVEKEAAREDEEVRVHEHRRQGPVNLVDGHGVASRMGKGNHHLGLSIPFRAVSVPPISSDKFRVALGFLFSPVQAFSMAVDNNRIHSTKWDSGVVQLLAEVRPAQIVLTRYWK